MTRVIRAALWAVAGLVGLFAVVGVIGMLLPESHTAAVRVRINQPRERVFAAISDVAAAPSWRSDLQRVEPLTSGGDSLRWRETSDFGTLVMMRESAEPPARLVTRIDDPDQPFGGRWIFELAPVAEGTLLTITEQGEVYNPYFRVMSRFIVGHYGTLESYARDLTRHLGGEEPVRLE